MNKPIIDMAELSPLPSPSRPKTVRFARVPSTPKIANAPSEGSKYEDLSRAVGDYMYNLGHTHCPSLNIALWTPSVASIGDLGYVDRDVGTFVKLFNVFSPDTFPGALIRAGAHPLLSPDYRNCKFKQGEMLPRERYVAHEMLQGRTSAYSTWKAPRASKAFLLTPTYEQRTLKDTRSMHAWLAEHMGSICRVFTKQGLTRDNLLLVTGTLTSPRSAMSVRTGSEDPVDQDDIVFRAPVRPKGRPVLGSFLFEATKQLHLVRDHP